MQSFSAALEDFRRARQQADLEQIMARLRGRSADLLSFEQVRQTLKATESQVRELRDIPLDAIVGSVGRYADFTRSFLPRHDSDAERWARVELAATGLKGMPPILVYQIGDVYFVEDGHHRVSVARQLGATHIQAYVTPVHTRVPLSPDVQPDDLILKAEYADFLERTHLDETRPGADLSTTAPGRYRVLLEQIEAYRCYLSQGQADEVDYACAAARWYDEMYLPVVQVIRERGVLRDFPRRTETDLYVWISEHRAALQANLGWNIRPDLAAEDWMAQFSGKSKRQPLTATPPPQWWRAERAAILEQGCLFGDILVPLSGEDRSWQALDQAVEIARLEGARLHGLHVARSPVYLEGREAQAMQDRFRERCELAGLSGELNLDVGNVALKICEWARWTDLVVTNLAHPPDARPLARLKSGLRNLILGCSRPLLTVPHVSYTLNRALLAYDGSPKADGALFVATYLAARWALTLTVITVKDKSNAAHQALTRAQTYLEAHGINARLIEQSGSVGRAIVDAAEESKSKLILMGGYGRGPHLQAVLGSTVDGVLRRSRLPVLICP